MFNDDVHTDVISGSKTPEFRGKTLREGYTFNGWDPVVSETVTKDIIYVAQWEKKDVPVLPGTGVSNNVTGYLIGTAGLLFLIIGVLNKKNKMNKE